MKVSENIITAILQRLAESYPLMLKAVGYNELLVDTEEQILDGHLLYLWEKGLIDTEMKFNPHRETWIVEADITRINAHGLDYLSEKNTIL